jgi:DnaJ domain
MAMEPDYYEILHVSTKADRGTIIAAYRRLARRYHPDLSSDPVATERMRQFNAAVETLSDPQKRAQYDARRAKSRGQTGEPGAPIESRDLMVYRQGSLGAIRRGRRPSPKWKRSTVARFSILAAGAIALGLLAMTAILLASDSDDGHQVVGGATSTPAAADASAAPVSPPQTPATSGSTTFSSGTWLVGEEMPPGRWRAIRSRACSWRRLSSIEGSSDTVAGSGTYLTVEILPSDAAFWSEGCGWWTQILTPPSATPTDPFGNGTWLVPREIAPGKWQNSDSSEGCSWTQLSSLSGEPSAVIASGVTNSIATMEITGGEMAFDSWGCGTWTRVGD